MNKNKSKINIIIAIIFSLITYYLRFEFCIQSILNNQINIMQYNYKKNINQLIKIKINFLNNKSFFSTKFRTKIKYENKTFFNSNIIF